MLVPLPDPGAATAPQVNAPKAATTGILVLMLNMSVYVLRLSQEGQEYWSVSQARTVDWKNVPHKWDVDESCKI